MRGYTPRLYRASVGSYIILAMSDTRERPALLPDTDRPHTSMERLKFRSRSSKKVAVGISGLLAEFVLLAVATYGRGGLDDPVVLVIIVALIAACASSAWLLIQGLQERRESHCGRGRTTAVRPCPKGPLRCSGRGQQARLFSVGNEVARSTGW